MQAPSLPHKGAVSPQLDASARAHAFEYGLQMGLGFAIDPPASSRREPFKTGKRGSQY